MWCVCVAALWHRERACHLELCRAAGRVKLWWETENKGEKLHPHTCADLSITFLLRMKEKFCIRILGGAKSRYWFIQQLNNSEVAHSPLGGIIHPAKLKREIWDSFLSGSGFSCRWGLAEEINTGSFEITTELIINLNCTADWLSHWIKITLMTWRGPFVQMRSVF